MIDDYILEKIREKYPQAKKEFLFKPEGALFDGDDLSLLLEHCSKIGVSDIHIEGYKHIFGDIHGVFYPISIKKINDNEAANILKKIYDDNAIARINTIEPIDTNYTIKMDNEIYRYRINAVGSTVGSDKTVQITIRTIPSEPPLLKIVNRGEPLNAPKGTIAIEKDIWDDFCPSEGLVIVTGPTGSGKTTLLAACIRRIAETPNINKKIITYEAPIEYVFDKCVTPSCIISQTEIVTQLKTFGNGVESGMRRKPNIILVGESRDAETTENSIIASQTGHLVYTTAHTNSPAETFKRLINIFPEGERQSKLMDLVDSTKLIISQRLLNTVDGKKCAIKEFISFGKTEKNLLRDCTYLNISSVIDLLILTKRQRFIDDAFLRYKEGVISKETFEKCEKDYGSLNLSDDDIFNTEINDIVYLYAKEFAVKEYSPNCHYGLIFEKGHINHGKYAIANKKNISYEDFLSETNCFIYKEYNLVDYKNKDIVADFKEIFISKNKLDKKEN